MKPKSILNVSKPFGTAQMAAALASAPDMPVPDNDAPTTTAATWHDAFVSHSYAKLKENLAKKRMGRPLSDNTKVQVAIRFDQDILAAFKATGRGWQTRINDLLRKYLDEVHH
jgi:uncharacterized protein (DUF4415 family)